MLKIGMSQDEMCTITVAVATGKLMLLKLPVQLQEAQCVCCNAVLHSKFHQLSTTECADPQGTFELCGKVLGL